MAYSIGNALTEQQKLESNFLTVRALLISQGMPENTATWAAAQVLHETNGLKSRVSKEDNNLSGIVWINKSYQPATKGRPRPASEGGHYAHYKEYRDWAKDFVRIVSFGARPKDAKSLEEYVDRLAKNNYFTDNKQAYYNGVKYWLDKVRGSMPANAPVKITEDATAVEQAPYNIPNPDDRIRYFDFDLDPKDKKALIWLGLGLLSLIIITRN